MTRENETATRPFGERSMAFDNESRSSFRAPIVDRYEGTLRFSDAEIRVAMLDQSATGFKLSTDDPRAIPKLHDAELEMDDGVRYDVQIRHVRRDGDSRTLGVQLVERRVSDPNGRRARRMRAVKGTILLLLVAASGFALQAAPVRDRLAKLSPFRTTAGPDGTPPTDASSGVPKLDRDHPFDFRRYLEDDCAAWLAPTPAQRRLMRALLDLSEGARARRLPPVQLAFVDFAAEGAMLQLLDAEQRSRLAQALERPMSGSALLADILRRYAPQVRPQELSEKFGALLVVSPAIAAEYGVSNETVAAVCRRLDETLTSAKSASQQREGVDAEQLMLDFTVRLTQLEAECRELVVPTTAKSKP